MPLPDVGADDSDAYAVRMLQLHLRRRLQRPLEEQPVAAAVFRGTCQVLLAACERELARLTQAESELDAGGVADANGGDPLPHRLRAARHFRTAQRGQLVRAVRALKEAVDEEAPEDRMTVLRALRQARNV